jgi:hypothetical protein
MLKFTIAIALSFACAYASAQSTEKTAELEKAKRVFIVDRDTYESTAHGAAAADKDSAGASYVEQSGVRRVHTEQVKTFSKECSDYVVTMTRDKADFIVVWDNRASEQTKWGQHTNEFTIYNRDGDLLGSGGTFRLSSAAKDICGILKKRAK